jgi:hypothetical protein
VNGCFGIALCLIPLGQSFGDRRYAGFRRQAALAGTLDHFAAIDNDREGRRVANPLPKVLLLTDAV